MVDRHAERERAALFWRTLNEYCDERKSTNEHTDREDDVELMPASQLGTENDLTDQVPDNAANAGECEDDTSHGAVVSMEPAAQDTCSHRKFNNRKTETNDKASYPIAPDCWIESESDVRHDDQDSCDATDGLRVELIKEKTSWNTTGHLA